MGWYSVSDLGRKKTTWVYDLPSADFKVLYALLKKFSEEHGLEPAVIGIRKYLPEERRECGLSALEFEAGKEAAAFAPDGRKTKNVKKGKGVPVDVDAGPCFVDSFDWHVRDLDDLKYIYFLFYDEGWPGSVVISKRASVLTPTEVVFSCQDRNPELGRDFLRMLEEEDVPAEPPIL